MNTWRMRVTILALTVLTTLACGARGETQFADRVAVIANEVAPGVERAVGLDFKYPPNVTVRSPEAVRDYLIRKLRSDFPPEEIERLSLAYRLLRLIPPDLDLEQLLLDLYSEQVVGYYDPATDSLYVVEGGDPLQVRLIVAHELVHALQAQYVPLEDLLTAETGNDRRIAAQAVFEGQGVLASLIALVPDRDLNDFPEFWTQFRETIRQDQQRMPIFSSAPLILREGLIFPYLGGADFVRWFTKEHPDTVPFGPRLPASTEQILHVAKYLTNDVPVDLLFEDEGVVHQDGLGEFEVRVMLTELSGSESTGATGAMGWDGDQYAVYQAGDDHAIVWWSVWDSDTSQRRFARILEQAWRPQQPPNREFHIQRQDLHGLPAVVLVDAPVGWPALEAPPRVSLTSGH